MSVIEWGKVNYSLNVIIGHKKGKTCSVTQYTRCLIWCYYSVEKKTFIVTWNNHGNCSQLDSIYHWYITFKKGIIIAILKTIFI